MKKNILELNSVSIIIDHKTILKNITCSVIEGDFIVIVGGNGAGKSTFFDAISGKKRLSAGQIFFKGVDISDFCEIDRVSDIVRIFQDPYLNCIGSLTVLENLALSQLAKKRIGLKKAVANMSIKKATELLNTVGISAEILDKKMSSLSGGQRQLIAFLMASQRDASLILLDEPTAALDPNSATKLLVHAKKYIKENKMTTLLITHDPLIAMHLGNKIWILEDGVIIKEYNQEEKKMIKTPEELIGQVNYNLLSI